MAGNPVAKATARAGYKTSAPRVRMLDGKIVKPVLYAGRHEGHGTYMAGAVDGELVCDASGKPLPLKQIGILT